MSELGLISTIVLTLIVGFVVLRPLFMKQDAVENIPTPTRLDELEAQRAAVLAAIREVDFDYETGKLTEADHTERREALVQQGVALLQEIDRLTAESEQASKPEGARVREKAR